MDRKYFRNFWWNILIISIKKTFNVFLAWATLVAVITLLVSQVFIPPSSEWRDMVTNLSWQIPAIVFVAALLIQFFWQPPLLFKEKADKVREYETHAFDLEPDTLFISRAGYWAARVGIKATGQRAVRGVQVYVTAIDGNENALDDAPLSPSDRLRNLSGAVTANPGGRAQKFIEILHWNPVVPEMGIPYNLNYQLQEAGVDIQKSPYSLPTAIPVQDHVLTIYATGEDVGPVEKEYKVSIVNKQLKISEVGHESQPAATVNQETL